MSILPLNISSPVRLLKSQQSDLRPSKWLIHNEIANNEGQKIHILNESIKLLLERISESADISAAEELLEIRFFFHFSIENI